jgi:hypothetical protein
VAFVQPPPAATTDERCLHGPVLLAQWLPELCMELVYVQPLTMCIQANLAALRMELENNSLCISQFNKRRNQPLRNINIQQLKHQIFI